MPRLQARSRNVVASDSEDDLALKPQPRRQTRFATNSPKKTSLSLGNSTPRDIQSSTAQDGEADDEEDEVDVLTTQLPSIRNARANGRTPKSRGVSARKSPFRSASQRKNAGKRQTPSKKTQTGGSSSQAARQLDSDDSDSELIVPGFPEGRRWLHSVRGMYRCVQFSLLSLVSVYSRPRFMLPHLTMISPGFSWFTSVSPLVYGCSGRPTMRLCEERCVGSPQVAITAGQ